MEPKTFEEWITEAERAFEQTEERSRTGNLSGALRCAFRGSRALIEALKLSQDVALTAAQRAGVPQDVTLP